MNQGKTVCFSTSGMDTNPGTQQQPKQSLQCALQHLKQGDNVLLKRGDAWYDPTMCFTLEDIGQPDQTIVLGAYGEGANPIIAAMSKYDFGAWEQKEEIYTIKPQNSFIYRVYYQGLPLVHVAIEQGDLSHGQWRFVDGKIHICIHGFDASQSIETIENDGMSANAVYMRNVQNLTISDIDFRGGSSLWGLLTAHAPTRGIVFRGLRFDRFLAYGVGFGNRQDTPKEAIHEDILIENCIVDTSWTSDMNNEARYKVGTTQLGANGESPYGDGIIFVNCVHRAIVRGCTIINQGHTGIGNEIKDISGGFKGHEYFGTRDILIEKNTISRGASSYLRAFGFCGSARQCTGIVIRQNYFVDLTNSNHFGGKDNYCYSNIFDTTTMTQSISHNRQPWCIDSMTGRQYPDTFVCQDILIANNTFYDQMVAVFLNEPHEKGLTEGIRIINNIIYGWYGPYGWAGVNGFDNALVFGFHAAGQEVKNNVLYRATPVQYSVLEGETHLSLDEANTLPNMQNNIMADPAFAKKPNHTPQSFVLSSASPCHKAGIPLAELLPKHLQAVDYFGNPIGDIPLVGAIAFEGK